jgi:serine/threonine protein phosphatase PrpC
MKERKYGTIISTGGTWGMILLQDGVALPFQYRDFRPFMGVPSTRTIVQCIVVPHPYDRGKFVCKDVVSIRIDELHQREGRILVKPPSNFSDGKIRLADSGAVITYRKSVTTQPLQEGDNVTCSMPPQTSGAAIALRVERSIATRLMNQPIGQSAVNPNLGIATLTQKPLPVALAGATRKGTRRAKSVNEDAFLVTPLADGEFWLAAIADGVSSTKDSWWASTTCMELLWRSRPAFEKKLVETFERSGISIVDEWMNYVHDQFRKMRARSAYQDATSTLTMAVGSRKVKKYVWGTCGDGRIYEFGPTSSRASTVISDEDLKLQRVSSGEDRYRLITHIAADPGGWSDHVVRERMLPANSKVVLCTDGVITTRTDPPLPLLKKFAVINSLAKAHSPRELQEMSERILTDISRLGEQDDLTIVVVKP